MNSLQKQITDWAKDVFGPTNATTLYNRMQEESMELKEAIFNQGTQEDVAEECADVLHLLFQISSLYDVDLIKATENKFGKNKTREWKINGDGTGQHV